jgi:hypothetical protein
MLILGRFLIQFLGWKHVLDTPKLIQNKRFQKISDVV